ncbi:MAG TPA: glycosyl hydrolase [Solirubrobacteraceae bacterium]|jgi:hypothetical protein
MRFLRLLLLPLLALSLAATAIAREQAPIPLPGGGNVKIKLPPAKPSKPAKGKGKKKPKKPAKPKTNLVQLGIADEKATMFSDPRFGALGLKTARRSVAWDVFDYDWALQEVDDWLKAAQFVGVRPVITFARSRVQSKLHVIPTRAQYLAMFKKFRARYPWVRDFVASNESNYSDPGFKRPELAAKYYMDMRRACPTCKVAAATLLEVPGKEKYMAKWLKRFLKVAKPRPKYWAIHNYFSANRFDTKGTKQILKLTKSGEIWVTEVGGLVKRRSNFAGKVKMKEGLTHAAQVTRFIFDRMLTLSPRIKRVYIFHWNAGGPLDSWDSGLIGPDGKARTSLNILTAKLKARRR